MLLASLAIPAILCLEVPLEIFGNNLEEFLFSLSDFLPFCLLLGFGGFLVIAAILFFLPKKAYRFALPVVVAIAFLFFLQGTFLNLGLDSLPGDNLGDVKISAGAVAVNTVVWCVVLGLAVAAGFIKKRRSVRTLCLLLSTVVLAIQLISTAFVALTTDQIALSKYERMKRSSAEYVPKIMTNENLTELSDDSNVFVFVVDRFDEEYAEKAYRETPDVYDELTGFTWFQDNISHYGHTFPAVTRMLTGAPFSCEDARADYHRAAFEGETPLKRLSDEGYKINIYTQALYAYSSESYLPDYIDNVVPSVKPAGIPTGAKFKISWNMIRMALYRCFPVAAKGVIGNISSNANESIVLESQSENIYSLDMKKVYQTATAEDFTLSAGKTFSFIHVMGCHSVDYDESFEKPSGDNAKNYAVSVRVSFKIIDRYLQEMKRLGVYDNATVIITGDHAAPVSDKTEVQGPRITALFVKPAGSGNEPLRLSSAQVSHEDLWATVFASEGLGYAGDYGTSVFAVPEGEERVRQYCWHTYVKNSLDEYIYEIRGSAKDFENWTEVNHRHYDKSLMD